MFGLFIESGCVKAVLSDYETNQTFVQSSSFMNGIAQLVTLKYLLQKTNFLNVTLKCAFSN